MAKHSLTLCSTKHIILHYRLETHCAQIYKHQSLINKLFTRAQFGTGLNNINFDIVSAQLCGEWITLCCYSHYTHGMAKINVMLVPTSDLSHLDMCDICVSSYTSVSYMHFIILLHQIISCFPFTVLLFFH